MEAVCQSGLASFRVIVWISYLMITVPVLGHKFIRGCLEYASNVVDLEDGVSTYESATCAAGQERLAATDSDES